MEENRRPRLVQQALREAADLIPEIEAARRDTTAIALLEVTAPLTSLEEDPGALLTALVERLPGLTETLGESITEAEPAGGD